jgi:TP901 family phage tail tape measure protein
LVDQNINTNITATANFSGLTAQLQAVTSQLVKLQTTTVGLNQKLNAQIGQMNRSFVDTMRSTGQFSSHFVTLSSDVDKFGKNLDSGRMKLGQYFNTWQGHAKQTSNIVKDLAKQQVMLQNAIVQPIGKNAQGLMQYNVMVARGLDENKNKIQLLRQEQAIMNKVMQDGATGLINWGKNTQWAGRQLTVGLTVPLAAFGAAASKAFREADTELIRLQKVYGGIAATSATELAKIRKDVSSLAKEMAGAYGVAFKDTISLAADLAATGKEGNDLLIATKQTTRLAVLGEVDRQTAMKATLAIQNAFKQNTKELTQSIDFLNAVENQTSTSLQDLTEAIPKAGPVIKALGGNVKDLALYLTAMKEGGIDATQGANAIKSAMASLINPTKKATDAFSGFGIDLKGIVTSNAGNLTGTILALQKALDKLDPLSKSRAIEQLFGKFQFARMSALFENLGKQGSQTLKVMDLMGASTSQLAAISDRELKMMTESASGRYKRALESVKADMAQVGESFLKINTFVLNVIDGIVKFVGKLPGPLKTILTFIGGLTAVAGPLIMLTGVLGNFFGYIIKGVFSLRQFFKGGDGFKLLTPEIVAADHAAKAIGESFYSDSKAAKIFEDAVLSLSRSFEILQTKATAATAATHSSVSMSTIAGNQVTAGPSSGRVVDKNSPYLGKPYSRDMSHAIPSGQEQPGTIFGVVPGTAPVNRKISNNPQMYMKEDLPKIPGVTSINSVSTGIVAGEAAKFHSMTAALAMQSKEELAALKQEVSATGTISAELSASYAAMLPPMIELTTMAANEGAAIVSELQAGKITVDQSRIKIIELNKTVEMMMAETATQVAATMGRTVNLTTVPLTSQPTVDPISGKSNMKEMFHKGTTASLVDKVARALGVKTSGGGYSIETTKPQRLNSGGQVYDPSKDGAVVPGDMSINYDNTPAKLEVGGYVLNKEASKNNPEIVSLAKNKYNGGGKVDALLTPGETYFDPQTTSQMMPTLEAANNGSRIQLHAGGGIVEAFLKMTKFGGKKPMLSKNLIDKLFPGRLTSRANSKYYEPKGNAGVFGGNVSNRKISASTAKINKDMEGVGVDPTTLLASIEARGGGSRLSTDVFLEGLFNAGVITRAEKTRLSKLVFSSYAKKIMSMGKINDYNNPVYSISEDLLRKELAGNSVGLSAWDKWSQSPGSFAHPKRRSSTGFLNSIEVDGKYIRFSNLEGSKSNKFYHSKEESNPFIKTLAETIPGYALGGKVIPKKHNYGIMNSNAFAAKNPHLYSTNPKAADNPLSWMKHGVHPAVEAMNQKIFSKYPNGQMPVDYANQKRPAGMYPMPASYYQDITNSDPLHGALQIGRYQPPMGIRNQQLGARVRYQGSGFMKAGLEPAFAIGDIESRAKTALFNYMQGDYAAIEDPAVQSYLSTIRTKFTGTLHRGVRNINDLPPVIKDLIRQGRWGDLVGKEFIMRRSSWSTNKDTAEGFGQLQMVASVQNRNAVPASQIFPDLTFHSPSGPVHVNESEVYMGGKFRIVAAGENNLKLEAVYDGKRENGGPVNAGKAYLVGEKGPEIFVPRNSGGIIPNYALGGKVRFAKHNYGLSGNPAKRAQQLAEQAAARAAYQQSAYGQSEISKPEYKEGPLSGARTTIPGMASTNVYGLSGSFPKFGGNIMSPMLNSIDKIPGLIKAHSLLAAQQISIGSKMLAAPILNIGKSLNTVSIKSAISIAQSTTKVQEGLSNATTKIKDSFTNMGKNIRNSASIFRESAIRSASPIGPIPEDRGILASARSNAKKSRFSNFASGNAQGSMMAGMGLTMAAGTLGGPYAGAMMGAGIAMQMGGLQMIQKMTSGIKEYGKASGGALKAVVGNIKAVSAGLKGLTIMEGIATVAGKGLGVALKAAMVDSPLVILLAIVAAATAAFKILQHLKKEREQDRKEVTLTNGITAKGAEQAGIKYHDLSSSIKDVNAQLELTRARGKAAFETFTNSGQVQGLTLSLGKLKEAIADAKKNQTELVGAFSNAGSGSASTEEKQKIVSDMAANLKAQFVASGMSADEATNKIFAMIKASKNADMAFNAISAKGFTKVTDAATATTTVIENLNKKMKERNISGSDLGNALSNSTAAIDSQMQKLIGTKDAQGKLVDAAQAYSMIMDKVNSKQGSNTTLTEEQLNSLKQTHPELEKILNTTDTTASTFAKWRIVLSGVQVDLKKITAEEAISIAQFEQGLQSAMDMQTKSGSGVLGKSQVIITKLQSEIGKGLQAQQKAHDQTMINIQDQTKALDKQIKKVQDLAAAKIKAIEDEQKANDFNANMQQLQIDNQDALAKGDMAGAAMAQIKIKQLADQRQKELALAAIRDKEAKDVDALNQKKEKLASDAEASAKRLAALEEASAKNQIRLDKIKSYQMSYENLLRDKANINLMKEGKEKEDAIKTFRGNLTTLGGTLSKDATGKDSILAGMVKDIFKGTMIGNKGESLAGQTSSFYNGSQIESKYVPGIADAKIGDQATDISLKAAESIKGKKGSTLDDVVEALKGKTKIVPPSAQGTAFGDSAIPQISGKNLVAASKNAMTESRSRFQPAGLDTVYRLFSFGGKTYAVDDVGVTYSYDSKNKVLGARVPGMASGGAVFGAGTGTSDSIPSMLSNGEYVINAKSAQSFGYKNLDGINKMAQGGLAMRYDISSGSKLKLATGEGPVGSSETVYNVTIELNGTNITVDDVMNKFDQRMRQVNATMGRTVTNRK